MSPKTLKPAEHRVLAKSASLKSLKTAMKGDKAALKEADVDTKSEIKTDLKAVKKEIVAETEIKQLKADIKTDKQSLSTAEGTEKTALKSQIKDAKTMIKADKEVVVNEETGRPYGLDADGEVHAPAKGTKLGQVEGTVVAAVERKDSKDAPEASTEAETTVTEVTEVAEVAEDTNTIPYTVPPKAAPTMSTIPQAKDKTLTPPVKGSKMGQKTAVAADADVVDIPYTVPPKAAPTVNTIADSTTDSTTTDATTATATTVVKKPSANDPLRASELDARRHRSLKNKHVQKEVDLTKDEIKALEKELEAMVRALHAMLTHTTHTTSCVIMHATHAHTPPTPHMTIDFLFLPDHH
jgi:HAMP domain-containing protein